jgi:hypothetical protein
MTEAATPTTGAAAVMIHDLVQARQALAAARRNGRPVHLFSAPGAGAYLGPALFKQIIDQARAAEPAARAFSCLDCAGEPGTALCAIRHGVEAVSLTARPDVLAPDVLAPDVLAPDVLAKVADAARQAGAELIPYPAAALDMADHDAAARLDAWIAGGTAAEGTMNG